MFQQRPAERGLARADFAGELHEALAFPDAVEQMVERLAVFVAVEKKARVRRDVERRLLQSIKLQIHAWLLAETSVSRKGKVWPPFPCLPLTLPVTKGRSPRRV